ncbi:MULTISPECIES: hypothetical protein [Atlantibacter]|uniref:hypothetical protein n=1 Tax=Atlantibacter TaxID=1903434 RepID=UPI001933D571|nr:MULTISPECIES: hypothetical protein [Atlantibacter]MBL7637053.1 hypothetical protein [Atlantibacter hermannii]MBL7674763.1 hypothetical protein [Atlantibacter hermannii]
MDNFIQSCESALRFIAQQQRTTSQETRQACQYKFHEWRDILFHLKMHYGVVSVRGKGIFVNHRAYQHWLRTHHGLVREVKKSKGS